MSVRVSVGHWQCSDLEKQYVNEVLEAGRLSYGRFSSELERRFAAMHGARFGVLSNSGTSSLQVALQALKEMNDWQDGDEVIVPAATFVATTNIVLHNRMRPVLVDIEPTTFNIDPFQIEAAITPRTRCIIPVNLFGQPADLSTIQEIANRRGLKVIVDSCETMLVRHHGRMAEWGDITCYSTYIAHLLTTGVGGLGLTNDPEIAVKMRSLVNHGRDGIYLSIDDDDNLDEGQRREVISRRFNFVSIGHSYRLTELEAALGLTQLETLAETIEQRRDNANYLDKKLGHLCEYLQLPEVLPGNQSAYMMYNMVVLVGSKWDFCNYLEEHGIETREALRLSDQPCYAGMWNPADYPIAQWLNERGAYIGCHQYLTREDLDYVVEVINDYFKKR